jgi:ATP-dependent Clp protease adaptor protein ClpS
MTPTRKNPRTEGDSSTAVEERVRVKKPKMFKVLLINDDYTTMDFVVAILETVFKKSPAEAVRVMLQVHQRGHGICGIYSRQIAESKIKIVHDKARDEGFPLRCTMEEA